MNPMTKYVYSLFFLALVSFSPFKAKAGDDVVVSIKPIHGLVQAVLGDTEKAKLLVSSNASPHGFQMKPSQRQMLENAKIVFYISPNFETFLAKPLKTISRQTHQVALVNAPALKLYEPRSGGLWDKHDHNAHDHHGHDHHDHDGHNHEHHGHDHHDHDHHRDDLHIWLSLDNAVMMVNYIENMMSELKPKNKAIYTKNAEKAKMRLAVLRAKIKKDMQAYSDKSFFVFHDAYQYFEKEFGLKAIGSLTINPEVAPSIKRMRELRQKIQSAKISVIFREPQFSDKIVKSLVKDLPVTIGVLDPIGYNIEPGQNMYFELMEKMHKAFIEGFNAQ